MPGRKPKPTKLKALKGTLQKCRMQLEPQPVSFIPAPPACLDRIAKVEWERISAELFGLGLLTNIDMAALAGYCQAYSRWYQESMKMKRESSVIKTALGNRIQNPRIGIMNTAASEMRKFLIEFGMTPSSRSKVNVGEKEPKTTFDAIPGGAKLNRASNTA